MKKLNEIPVKNPFRVPENYFEELNSKIISETSGYDQKVVKIGLYRRLKPYLLVAASVTVLIVLTFTAINLFIPNEINPQVSEVLFDNDTEIYLDDFDLLMLEESAASVTFSEELPEISKSDIIDYLILENIDINEIYEQL